MLRHVYYRHVYSRLVEKVDAQIGQIPTALRDAGPEHDAIAVFTSDHGDTAGAHELNQKDSLYDEAARVPLIVAGAGIAGGHVVDEPVSLIDVRRVLRDGCVAGGDRSARYIHRE